MRVAAFYAAIVPLPEFDELPKIEKLGLRHAWNAFGAGDELGTVNLLTPERVLGAARLVRTGEVINLSVPLDAIDPPLYARELMKHTIFPVDRNTLDDRLDFFPQSSSQWDGLRHVRAREFGWWGGHTDEAALRPGSGPLGIERWVEHGVVGRGVLLDIARDLEQREGTFDPFVSRSITPAMLDAAAERQGVSLEHGDMLCVRTGWMGKYLAQERPERERIGNTHSFIGLAADEDMSRWLWNQHVTAIASDNPAIEVSPGDPKIGSFHRRALPLLGLMLGELFALDRVAERSAADGRWTFLFVSVPLYLRGGVGSPANAIAIR
jgi:kynurenine formamidase